MGSDGGMCGIGLHDPKRYQRARALLAPFYFLEDYGWHERAKDANYAWWDSPASDGFTAPDWIVGTYGTGQDFDYCETLRDVLLSDPAEGELCCDPTLTFAELAEDIATRPLSGYGSAPWRYPEADRMYATTSRMGGLYDPNGRRMTELEMMVWEVTGPFGGAERRRASLGALADVVVRDWWEELGEIVDARRTFSDETWT